MERLTFIDGFQFGCGFLVAWILGSIIISILMAIVMFLLGILGVVSLGSIGGFLEGNLLTYPFFA